MSRMNYLDKLLDGVAVEWVNLGAITKIKTGQAVSKEIISKNPGEFPVINSGREPLGFINQWNTDQNPIGITSRGAGVGSVTWQEGKYFRGNLNYSVTINDLNSLEIRYLYHLLLSKQLEIQSLCTFDGIPALNASNLKDLKIPIPCPENSEKSLEIQAEIVRILDAMTAHAAELIAELTLRKKQYNYYRDKLLSFEDGEVEWKTLGEICDIYTGGEPPKSSLISKTQTKIYKYPIYGNGADVYGYTDTYRIDKDVVTISSIGANTGKIYYRKAFFSPIIRLKVLVPKSNNILPRYIFHALSSIKIESKSSSVPNMNASDVKRIAIPMPSVEKQAYIVEILDKFDALTTSITEGLPREIELRQKQYEYYRDALMRFPKTDNISE